MLIALAVSDHVHHDSAHAWWTTSEEGFASCPMTQAALVRMLVREGMSAATAIEVLAEILAVEGHVFWPDDLALDEIDLTNVIGHRQVTDAYLAALARSRSGWLQTFDRGLQASHADVAILIPTA